MNNRSDHFAIVQYEDRPLNDFKSLVEQNQYYANRNGIRHFLFKSGYENVPPWWRKVFLVRDLLQHYTAVLWVDSDAAVVSSDHFFTLFNDKHFVLSPNPPMLNSESLSMFSAPFCAGVWGVRNTPEGRVLMDTWANLYDSTLWKQIDDAKWIHTKGSYGGIAYEQGAFETGIWRKSDYVEWIENKTSDVLNHLPKKDSLVRGQKCSKGIFAVHYWKGNRGHISEHWPNRV